MTVISGLKCLELYQNSGPLGSLVRMLLGSSIWRSTRCTLTWKTKVTPSKRLLFRLAPSMPRTGGTDAQLLPTITRFDATCGDLPGKEFTGTRHAMKLIQAVNMWRTPTATDADGRGTYATYNAYKDRIERGKQISLANQVKFPQLWPTPKATDYKGSGPAGSKSAEHDLKKHNLKGVVMFYPTPTTGAGLCGGTGNFQQLKNLEARGQITEEERRSMAAGNGGQLNPDWVEWLMGFPPGWTEV